MRYFSEKHRLNTGNVPEPAGNTIQEIRNMDRPAYIEALGRDILGCVEYAKPLSRYDAESYDLLTPVVKTVKLRYVGADSWGRHVYLDEEDKVWKLLDCNTPRVICETRGNIPYASVNNDFHGEPDYPIPPHIGWEFKYYARVKPIASPNGYKREDVEEPLVLKPEDWTKQEWKTLCKLSGRLPPDHTQRIIMRLSSIETYVSAPADNMDG